MTALRGAVIAPVRGVAGGFGAYLQGAALLARTPSLWPWALVPMLVFLALVMGLSVLGIGQVHHLLTTAMAPTSLLGAAAAWLAEVALGLAVVGLAVLLALALTQALSGFALDRIARAQEAALGAGPRPEVPFATSVLLGLRATLVALFVATSLVVILTVLSVLVPPLALVTVPLKVVVAALAVAWDLLDYPLGARGLGIRARLRWARRNAPAVLGFALAAGLTLLVPGLNLLLLPWGVAGATRLVTLGEEEASRSS